MIKKLLLFALLSIVIETQAVLLKDGSSVPRAKVDHVYYALMSLYHNKNIQKHFLLADLMKSCHQTPKKLGLYAHGIDDMHDGFENWDNKERFETAVALDLCDKNGIIDEETAHIILSCVQCLFKGVIPISIDVRSPISWLAWTEIFKKSSIKK